MPNECFFNFLKYLFPTLLGLVVVGNFIVFTFSTIWSLFLLKKIRMNWLNRRNISTSNKEEYTRATIELNTNIFFILVLSIEAMHLFIKGIGFGLFFMFGYLPDSVTSTYSYWTACNRLQTIYPAVSSFSWLPIHLYRIGLTNGLLATLILLLGVLVYYLSQAHNNDRVNFKRIKQLLIVAYIQFLIVFMLTGIIWTFLLGAVVFVFFLAINYIWVIKYSLKLNSTLKRRRDDTYWAESNSTYLQQSRLLTQFQSRLTLFLVSLTVYLVSVLCSTIGNWVGLIPPNPCFFEPIYHFYMQEPSEEIVLAAGYISAVLLILSDLGILQFDCVLIFLNLGYLCSRWYYSRIAHSATRREIQKLLDDYNQSILTNTRNY